jgi:hypothetical protein
MNKGIVLGAYFGVALFVLVNALLMVLSPRKFAMFHALWTRTTGLVKARAEYPHDSAASLRGAGAALIVIAVVMILLPLSWMFAPHSLPEAKVEHGATQTDWAQWALGAITCCMLAFGLFMLLRPDKSFSFMRRQMPGWQPTLAPSPAGLTFIRAVGLLMALLCAAVLRKLLLP